MGDLQGIIKRLRGEQEELWASREVEKKGLLQEKSMVENQGRGGADCSKIGGGGGGEGISVAAVAAANVFVLIIAPGYFIK